jgi:hypothetical protein
VSIHDGWATTPTVFRNAGAVAVAARVESVSAIAVAALAPDAPRATTQAKRPRTTVVELKRKVVSVRKS